MSETEVPAPGKRVEYSEDLMDKAFDELKGGRTLTNICKKEVWAPAIQTFMRWVKEHELDSRYARARQVGWELMADEIIDVAKDGSNDWMEKKRPDGSVLEVVNHEHVSRSTLIVNTMKWVIAKRVPEYSDKVDVRLPDNGEPINFVVNLAKSKPEETAEDGV